MNCLTHKCFSDSDPSSRVSLRFSKSQDSPSPLGYVTVRHKYTENSGSHPGSLNTSRVFGNGRDVAKCPAFSSTCAQTQKIVQMPVDGDRARKMSQVITDMRVYVLR